MEASTKPREKLRVLCIHGYRQDANSLKSKLGSFRKFVRDYADFEFVCAPHIAPPIPDDGQNNTPDESDPDNTNQRSWWFNKDDGTFKGTNKSGPAIGFEESLRLVEHEWETKGPFQGLLGFSQGACFVGLICHLNLQKKTTIKPYFAIIASGFRSGSLVHMNCYDTPIEIPSLHIFGSKDEIIPTTMSTDLASTFKNKSIILHPGGHYFPASAAQKQNYVHFFQDRLIEYLEAKELMCMANQNVIEIETKCSSDSE